jgi:hypothetical protein
MSSHPSNGREPPDQPAGDPGLDRALALLRQALAHAESTRQDPWQFAVAWSTLQVLGLTDAALARLLEQGHVEHRLETTPDGARRRTFGEPRAAPPRLLSSLALTAAGAAYACRQVGSMRADPGAIPTPYWDAHDRELWFRGRLVKYFRPDASAPGVVLDAFQERNWQRCIANPFRNRQGCADPKGALHKAVERLNEATRPYGLRFRANGQGDLRWEADE